MGNRKGLTVLDVLITLAIVLFLLAVFLPVSHNSHRISLREVCRTNLKGLGVAISVYNGDYKDTYPVLSGSGLWAKELGFAYDMKKPDFAPGGEQSEVGRTITASWYLLVREADVSPKSFVCPSSSQAIFDGDNSKALDLTELWDFGSDPYQHVSYAMQNPYGRYAADGTEGARFAVAADMNPWIESGDFVKPGAKDGVPAIIKADDEETWNLGNSWNHPIYRRRFFKDRPVKGTRYGQNVLFGDGHASFEKFPNVGVKNDNIYTFWSEDEASADQRRQGGKNPTARDKENDAKSTDDSFLVL